MCTTCRVKRPQSSAPERNPTRGKYQKHSKQVFAIAMSQYSAGIEPSSIARDLSIPMGALTTWFSSGLPRKDRGGANNVKILPHISEYIDQHVDWEEFGVRLCGQAVCEHLKSKLTKSYNKLIKTSPANCKGYILHTKTFIAASIAMEDIDRQ